MHKATHKAMIPRLKVTRQSLLKAFVCTDKVGHLNIDPCAGYQLPSPLSGAFKHRSSRYFFTIAPKHNRSKGRHTYCNATCSGTCAVIPYFTCVHIKVLLLQKRRKKFSYWVLCIFLIKLDTWSLNYQNQTLSTSTAMSRDFVLVKFYLVYWLIIRTQNAPAK